MITKKNILLVYPEIPKATYWSFNTSLELMGKKANMPPLGLITIAKMLPENYNLSLCDLNVSELSDEQIISADYIFASAMIVQKDSLQNLIDRSNKLGTPVVVGGPFPTSCYDEIEGATHFVLGEAENVIYDFLEDFEKGVAKKAYAKPVRESEFNKLKSYFGDDIKITRENNYVNINKAQVPRFDLLGNLQLYQSMAIQTSRGCPIGCEFCDIWRRFGKIPRQKSFDLLKKEFEALNSVNWHGSVFIVDDNFIGNKKIAKKLLKDIAAWQKAHDYPFELYTEVTLTLADDDELLSLMRDAGFDFVFIGIETPAEESLLETRKAINTKGTMSEKVAHIQSYGMQVAAGFIVGFDNDPSDIAKLMTNCIQELGIPMAMVGLLQALPDTDLTDRLEKTGRLLKKSTGNNTHEFSLNFISKRPAEDVVEDYKNILQSIYPPHLKSYYKRCATLRKKYKHNPNIRSRTELVHLKAITKFLWRSIFKQYRWNCWKFLLETIFTNPKFFSMACTLSVQGHHFREITRLAFEIENLESHFREYLTSIKKRVRSEFEEKYKAGEIRVDRLTTTIENYRSEIKRTLRPKIKRISKKYGLPLEKTYADFIERLEITLEELRLEYGIAASPA